MDAKRTDIPAGQPATPSVRKEMSKTGRQPGDGVGDTPATPVATPDSPVATPTETRTEAPSGVNKEVWAEAERAALNTGGFSGIDDEGREKLVQSQYDKMVESDRQTKQWAYGEDKAVKGGILGDI